MRNSFGILFAVVMSLFISAGCGSGTDYSPTTTPVQPPSTSDTSGTGTGPEATQPRPTATTYILPDQGSAPLPAKSIGSVTTPTASKSFAQTGTANSTSKILLNCTPHSYPQRTHRSLAVDPLNDNKIYIGVEQEGFFKTDDGGKTWERAVNGVKASDRTEGPGPCYEEFYSTIIYPQYSDHICISMAGGPGTVGLANTIAGNNGVYCSVDGAESWVQRVSPDMNTAVYALAADPTDFDTMYAGMNGGSCSNLPPVCEPETYFNTIGSVYKTTDGGLTWTELNTLATRDVRVIVVRTHPLNPNWVIAATFSKVTVQGGGAGKFEESHQLGVIRSQDGGKTWTSSVNGMNPDPNEQALLGMEASPLNPSRLYVTASSNRSYLSSDWGQSFNPSRRMTAFVFDSFDTTGLHMLGSNGESIQASHDGGATWTIISATPGYISFDKGFPTTMVWSKNDANTVFLAGPYTSIYKSSNGGLTWSQLLSGDLLPK